MLHTTASSTTQVPELMPICDRPEGHTFVFMGMIGIPVPDSNMVAINNRFYCTKCLCIVTMEDRRVERNEVEPMQMGTTTGQIQ